MTSNAFSNKLKGSKAFTVDYVAVGMKNKKQLQKVIILIWFSGIYIVNISQFKILLQENICLRRGRNPIISHKYSSSHGQKGVCSQLWPDVDMPFSAHTGMITNAFFTH